MDNTTTILALGVLAIVGVVLFLKFSGNTNVSPPPYTTNIGMCEKAVAVGGTAYASSKGVPPQAGATVSSMAAPTVCNVLGKIADIAKQAPMAVAKGAVKVAKDIKAAGRNVEQGLKAAPKAVKTGIIKAPSVAKDVVTGIVGSIF